MAGKPYVLTLEHDRPDEALYVSISRALIADIARQRLKPGDRLPGSRTLAAMLDVNRNTVHAAVAELSAQGWVEAIPARGVFVRAREDTESPRPFSRATALRDQVPARLGFELAAPVQSRIGRASVGALLLDGGVPDPRLFPSELLARAYRRALRKGAERLLDYGDARGEPVLRTVLADLLTRQRGLAATADDVLITRGSQHAIWLAAHTLVAPGDRVGVESWGYPPAWDALRSAGATLVPLEVDADGVRIDSLESALATGPLRAVYLTPHHQYPTMVALSAQRRLRLLALAKQHRFAVLEDDYAHEFQYEGRPRLPLASADRAGVVVYIGTLSKILAPGLRIGYVVAPRALLDSMAALRTMSDRQGDSTAEAAVAELLEDGEVERHARRVRRVYRERRDALAQALTHKLGERVSFEVPSGGMAMWVRVHDTVPEQWVERARARGVTFRAGRVFSLAVHATEQGAVPFVRMGFTRLDTRELVRAVSIAAAVF
jgi:GntR family transcriptional regulator/MocR family aminotransferase